MIRDDDDVDVCIEYVLFAMIYKFSGFMRKFQQKKNEQRMKNSNHNNNAAAAADAYVCVW